MRGECIGEYRCLYTLYTQTFYTPQPIHLYTKCGVEFAMTRRKCAQKSAHKLHTTLARGFGASSSTTRDASTQQVVERHAVVHDKRRPDDAEHSEC